MQDGKNHSQDSPQEKKQDSQPLQRDGGDDALENLVATGADIDEDLNIAGEITGDKNKGETGAN